MTLDAQECTGPPDDDGGPDQRAEAATTTNNTPTAEQVDTSDRSGPTPALPALDDPVATTPQTHTYPRTLSEENVVDALTNIGEAARAA